MIISSVVTVAVSGRNKKYWEDKGYSGKIIQAKIDDLPKNSNISIDCKCDRCGKEYVCRYATYTKYCKSCGCTIRSENRKSALNKPATYTLEEVVEFLKKYNVKTHTLTALNKHLNDIVGLRESLYYYTPEIVLVTEKVASLVHRNTCEECDKKTSFISIEKGFRKYCHTHSDKGLAIARSKAIIDSAITRVSELYTIVDAPLTIKGNFTLQCEKGHSFTKCLNNGKWNGNIARLCPQCFPNNISKPEFEIKDFLESYGIEVVQQYRIEGRKTIDLYLPQYKIGIEYNGLMFHSFGKSKYTMLDNADIEDRNIHLNKTKACADLGIQLLHIFSNEWEEKQEVWKSVLLAKCGKTRRIFARKCEVKLVDSSAYRTFVEDNHLQGYAPSSIRYGLYYEDTLVAVAGFSKNRFSGKGDYELIRFANILNTTVVGGFSKLLAHFSKNNGGSVISYANLRWSTGSVYEANGFVLLNNSAPNYWYLNKDGLHSRLNFQRHKLNDSSTKSESEIMFDRGFRRVWDCGNSVYQYST